MVKLILKYLSELKSDLYYKNEVLFLHVSTFIMCVCIRWALVFFHSNFPPFIPSGGACRNLSSFPRLLSFILVLFYRGCGDVLPAKKMFCSQSFLHHWLHDCTLCGNITQDNLIGWSTMTRSLFLAKPLYWLYYYDAQSILNQTFSLAVFTLRQWNFQCPIIIRDPVRSGVILHYKRERQLVKQQLMELISSLYCCCHDSL